MRWIIGALLCVTAGCAGSDSNAPPAKPAPAPNAGPKVKVDAPGVHVDVERNGQGKTKVDVQAPGTDVRVNPK